MGQRATQRRLVAALPGYIDGSHVPKFEPGAVDDGGDVEAMLRNLADSALMADDRAALEARAIELTRQRAQEIVTAGVGAGEGRDIALESFDEAHPSRPKDALDAADWNEMKSRVARFATFVAAAVAVSGDPTPVITHRSRT